MPHDTSPDGASHVGLAGHTAFVGTITAPTGSSCHDGHDVTTVTTKNLWRVVFVAPSCSSCIARQHRCEIDRLPRAVSAFHVQAVVPDAIK
jgi:hypothetical protein